MENITDHKIRWALVIGLLILPPLLVHSANNEILPRLILTIVLLTVLPGTFIAFAFNPKEKPISSAPRLKGKYSEVVLKRWDKGAKIFAVVIYSLIFFYLAVPLLSGSYRFLISKEQLTIVEGSIKNQDSSFGMVFIAWFFDLKESGDHYQFWYPNMIRSAGEKYRFTILSGTDFVLDSEKIE